jgi:hypothetical protein
MGWFGNKEKEKQMSVSKRDVLPTSAIQKPVGDLGAEGVKSVEPSTRSALGDTSAHGDESLAAWKRDAKRPGLGVGIEGCGAGGVVVGGE